MFIDQLNEDFNESGPNDMARTRILELEDGQKIKVTASDPFGFWRIAFTKGTVPKELKGEYTTYSDAKKAVESYLLKKKNVSIKAQKETVAEVEDKED